MDIKKSDRFVDARSTEMIVKDLTTKVSELEEAIKTIQAELRNYDIFIYLPSLFYEEDTEHATYPKTIGNAQESED